MQINFNHQNGIRSIYDVVLYGKFSCTTDQNCGHSACGLSLRIILIHYTYLHISFIATLEAYNYS